MADKKHAGGRPTKYKEEYSIQAEKLCKKGFTDVDMADFFGVTVPTIDNWKKEYSEFFGALTRGKALYDDEEVVKSFHKRAVGFRFEEKVYEVNDAGEMVLTKVFEKEQAPDAGAALNWLKNRQPKKWRDKSQLDHTSSDKSMSPTQITEEQLSDKLKDLGIDC